MVSWIKIGDKYFDVLNFKDFNFSIQVVNPFPTAELNAEFDVSNNPSYHEYFYSLFYNQMNKMKGEYSFTLTTPDFRTHHTFITDISNSINSNGYHIMTISFHYDYFDFEKLDERRDRIIDYVLGENKI
jgi:hypothetical protein